MVRNHKIPSPNHAMMFFINEEKLIQIFMDCDDFCKVFTPIANKAKLPLNKKSHNKPTLCESEMMTILICYHLSGMKCFKYYYKRLVLGYMGEHFPKLVSYNRFVELIPRNMTHLWVFLNSVRLGKQMGISYIDFKKLTHTPIISPTKNII